MYSYTIGFVLLMWEVDCVRQDFRCPDVQPRELDLVELDGEWYLAAVATDMNITGECAFMVFNHKNTNTTDVSISWVTNNTASYYNGSVALTVGRNGGDLLLVTYIDKKTETYSVLAVDYEHYAVIFACYDDPSGNGSTYELWKLTRAPHLKRTDAVQLDRAVANYSLQNTSFMFFNNSERSCKINGGYLNQASLVLTSATALALFRRLY